MARTRSVEAQTYSVGEVAKLASVTVRALHHYDEIGLLAPSERTAAGYRRYTHGDLLRLQRIRLFRALDFTLDEVRILLEAPDDELRSALVTQRAALLRRLEETESLVAIINRVLDSTPAEPHEGTDMNEERLEMVEELFKGFRTDEFEHEAKGRWGDTDAWKESKRRVAAYGLDDWKEMAVEAKAINDGLLAHMQAGDAASSPEAMALAEQHRVHIGKWFYDCTHEIHAGLADMYVADPRFRANYDDQAPGFADYLSAAIHANAERA